jgi:hypothetical protein
MMHVSPCAWYCFDLKEAAAWDVRDFKDKTMVLARDNSCAIELVAARKLENADDGEISDYHEQYLRDEDIRPLKTLMAENPYKIVTIVTKGFGKDERRRIVCHAFWNNYCAFVEYRGLRRDGREPRMQAFYEIVNSLQPLALD